MQKIWAVSYNGENGKAGVWHIFKGKSDGSEIVDLSEMGDHGSNCEYVLSYSPDGFYCVQFQVWI